MHPLVPGPVRKIGIQSRSLTGYFPSIGRYESSLERDFMEIVRFNRTIELYTPQPVTIHYRDSTGTPHRYTPDGLIQFHQGLALDDTRPLLVEIKYRADYQGKLRELLPKFRAAYRYAKQQGWRFKVFTDYHIRTPYLKNIRFLEAFKQREIDALLAHNMLLHLEDIQETDPEALIMAMFRDRFNQAAVLPIVWHLVASGQIGCNLSEPLTMRSRLWCLSGG